MAEYKFSDFAPNSSPTGVDELVGLSGGDNARFTLSVLSDFFQSQISTVDPLPAGTPAKVMYFNADTNEWGASINFVTDGYVVGIGNQTPAEDTLLNIENYDDTYNSLLNVYNKNSSDVITKMVNYSKFGIFYISEGSVPANIDSADRANDYGLYVEKGIVAGNDIFMNNASDSQIRFADIDVTTGEATDRGVILQDTSQLSIMAETVAIKNLANTATYALGYTIGSGTTVLYSGNMQCYTKGSQKGVVLGTEFVADVFSTEVKSALHIGNADASDLTNMFTIALDSNMDSGFSNANLILKIGMDGKIYMKLPTSLGGSPTGSLLQLWNDSGTLKVG